MVSNPVEKDSSQEASRKAKDSFYRGVCLSYFLAVVAHTVNLQSEAVLLRDACGGDLAKTARLASTCNALTGLLGLAINQVLGKLSDSFGRKLFFLFGPLAQMTAGLVAFSRPGSAAALAIGKVARGIFTTFSGTVMCGAAMQDSFQGEEFAVKSAKAGSVIGAGIMVGPIIEAIMLRRLQKGGERFTFLLLTAIGAASLMNVQVNIGETLSVEKRARFSVGNVVAAANPFGFIKIFTHGTVALKKLVLTANLQYTIDGKNMSDFSQIWMREHLKLSIEGIRNFVVGYGFLSILSQAKLTPMLLKRLSARAFVSFTNFTNMLAFTLRGAAESSALFFGVLPLMLPGVNGGSALALSPLISREMRESGFGLGESSAWSNNLRVVLGSVAALIFGSFYAWAKRKGLNPGNTYLVAGLLGAALPQMLFTLMVKESELRSSETASTKQQSK